MNEVALCERLRIAAPAIYAVYRHEHRVNRRKPFPQELVIAAKAAARKGIDAATGSPSPTAAKLTIATVSAREEPCASCQASPEAFTGTLSELEAVIEVLDQLGDRGDDFELADRIDREIVDRLACGRSEAEVAREMTRRGVTLSPTDVRIRVVDRSVRILLSLTERRPKDFAELRALPPFIRIVEGKNNGKRYHLFRRPGFEVMLPGSPGDADFMTAYHKAAHQYDAGIRSRDLRKASTRSTRPHLDEPMLAAA